LAAAGIDGARHPQSQESRSARKPSTLAPVDPAFAIDVLRARRCGSGATQRRADEVCLGGGVGLAIVLECRREPALELAVFHSDGRVPAQIVAAIQLVAKSRRAGWHEMEVVGAASWVRLPEPVHLGGAIWRVEVA